MAPRFVRGVMVAETSQPGNWFALVDTARDPSLHGLVTQCKDQHCLIGGDVAAVLAPTLPYIVRLNNEEPLAVAWRGKGAGQSWGILLQSAGSLDQMRLHFKKFINARLPDGTLALFRFYDPRVFRTYIRAALPEERLPWFKGVVRYSVESTQAGHYHDFRINEGQLFDGSHPA
jgi:Domain of unknown function (DUF4123)